VDGAADNPEAVRAIAKAGIPVWAQFGFTPQTTQAFGGFENITDDVRQRMGDTLVQQARMLEDAGASMFDCTNVGNEIVGAIAKAVSIPVLGGHNTGSKADGRVTVSYSWLGYDAGRLDQEKSRGGVVNVGRIMLEGVASYFQSVRDGTAAP
jgi:3-methyl-2-oxobutanoate hydroxymethyltransferase